MKEKIYYCVKDQQFDTEEEALKFWLLLGRFKKYYDIFKYNNNHYTEYNLKELTEDDVKRIIANYNNVFINYKNSNNSYSFKDFDKINLDKLENIILLETKGYKNNICGGLRIEYIDNKFIAIY